VAAKKSRTSTTRTAQGSDASELMQSLLGARPLATAAGDPLIHGVLIGVLHDFDALGQPRIVVPGRMEMPRVARAICALSPGQEGCQCALLFEGGDPARPLVMGVLQEPVLTLHAVGAATTTQEAETFSVEAEQAIELRCGKASLRLSSDGRIELRGTTVVSHATGLNRIRGASIKLN
jgi:hypothetical protein